MLENFRKKSIDSLRQASSNAVSVFQKTIDELTSINNQIKVEKQEREEKISVLTTEVSTLETQASQNEKVISKINSILED